MASIPQQSLFVWSDIDELGDLERLKLVLKQLPDEALMRKLEQKRDRGRDDYPVRAMWNSLIAGIVYQHRSIESLRRELARNETLLAVCGFDILKGKAAVPTAAAYSRFIANLYEHEEVIEAIFSDLRYKLTQAIPDFGTMLAVDGKAIQSFGNPVTDKKKVQCPDGRRDTDAAWGVKRYNGVGKDGKQWQKEIKWFGYKLHLLVDAKYELPIDFIVTDGAAAEQPRAHELIERLHDCAPEIAERSEYIMADRGYDDGKLLIKAYDTMGISPIIDIRNVWKDGEKYKTVPGTKNVVYDYAGNVVCICPKTLKEHTMSYGGFEKDRNTQKYLCPARHKGIPCQGQSQCDIDRQVRIPLCTDRRIFTPVARASYKWERLYAMRTAVERVNARIDGAFLFEQHFIRGIKKMKLRLSLAFITMLSMAYGRLLQNNPELMRSLVRLPA